MWGKSQANYFKHLKEILSSDKAIVLGDFTENYTFMIQDELYKAITAARSNGPFTQLPFII